MRACHVMPFGPRLMEDGGAEFRLWAPTARPVRDVFIPNALYWLEEFRFDGLRLDAAHAANAWPATQVSPPAPRDGHALPLRANFSDASLDLAPDEAQTLFQLADTPCRLGPWDAQLLLA